MLRIEFKVLILLFFNFIMSIHNSQKTDLYINSNEVSNIKVLETIIKDPKMIVYTEGIVITETKLYLSGGGYGDSSLVRCDYNQINQLFSNCTSINIEKKYFAEGIALINDKIYMLTYKEKDILVFNSDMSPYNDGKYYHIQSMPNQLREGWGLYYNKNKVYSTDGSDKIFVLNANDLSQVVREIQVSENGYYVNNLNHIMVIKDDNGNDTEEAYINIYLTEFIIKVDLNTGKVLKKYSANEVINKEIGMNKSLSLNDIKYNGYVCNGIYQIGNKIYITGKNWMGIFLVDI